MDISKPNVFGSSHHGSVEMNLISIHEDLGLAQCVKGSSVATSCGVGHRCGSDPALLWLWCRPTTVAPIRPLAWELPSAADAALKRSKKKKKMNMFKMERRPIAPATFKVSAKVVPFWQLFPKSKVLPLTLSLSTFINRSCWLPSNLSHHPSQPLDNIGQAGIWAPPSFLTSALLPSLPSPLTCTIFFRACDGTSSDVFSS